MSVVFNTNFSGLAGLGAALVSLLHHCSAPRELRLYVLCTGLREEDKSSIRTTAATAGYPSEVVFIDYDARQLFGHLRPLHGDYTTYGKSLIPSSIDDTHVLYLDTDLLVTLDVLQLTPHRSAEHPISAVSGATMRDALDTRFLVGTLGIDADRPYFNAGVLLFNVERYRNERYAQRWEELCRTHSEDFAVVDQTLFNAIAGGAIGLLPAHCNRPWTPGVELSPAQRSGAILHFIGSPKPWDFLGSRLHSAYSMWRSFTPDAWHAKYCIWTRTQVQRTWHIRRSILRHLLNSKRPTLATTITR